MNYQRLYLALVARAKERVTDGYVEKHHILPRCMGGSNAAANIVSFTAREHFVAHLLLVKMHPGNKALVFAAHMMTVGHRRLCNRKYEWLRRRHATATSEAKRGNTYGLGKTPSTETRARLRAAALGNKRCAGRVLSRETKDALSDAHAGRPKSPAHAAAMSRAMLLESSKLPPYANGQARVPGVTQRKNGAFVARARVNGERKYLGFFWTIEEAERAIRELGND